VLKHYRHCDEYESIQLANDGACKNVHTGKPLLVTRTCMRMHFYRKKFLLVVRSEENRSVWKFQGSSLTKRETYLVRARKQ
jgi:hypothetical protein